MTTAPLPIVARIPPWLTRIYYCLLATVLLIAALAKAFWLPPGARTGLFQHSWLMSLVVAVEIIAAGWLVLLGHHYPAVTRRMGIALFTLLALVSLQAWVRGQPCQCFGTDAIGPEASLAFDVIAIVALAWLPFPAATRPEARVRAWRAMPVVSVLAIVLAVWTFRQSPVELAADGHVATGVRAVALKPVTWVGQRLPLFEYLEIDADLTAGRWLVVLFRPDCAHCLRLIPVLRGRVEAGDGSHRLAMVDLSGGAARGAITGTVGKFSEFGRLNPERQWILVPPVGVELVDGQVEAVLDADRLGAWHPAGSPSVSRETETE